MLRRLLTALAHRRGRGLSTVDAAAAPARPPVVESWPVVHDPRRCPACQMPLPPGIAHYCRLHTYPGRGV